MKNKLTFTVLFSVLLLAACAPLGPGSLNTTATSVPPTNTPLPTATGVPTAVVPTPTHLPVDLTPAQLAAIQAAAKRYNVAVELIKVESTEVVTWPSGCLGVVLPGVMCTQALVPGFRIIMEAKGQRFEFHTNQDGTSVIDAARQLATVRLVVRAADGSMQLANAGMALGPTYNPAFNGFLPLGASTAGTAYVLGYAGSGKAFTVDSAGANELSFIKDTTSGLALWRGGLGTQAKLAWGTKPGGDGSSSLVISNLDGSGLETLLTLDKGTTAPIQLVAEFWSADGQALYFSKEPYGIGGYILFGGASNLYKIDVATKKVSELIPQAAANGPMACLDALSGDYRFVADHCSQKFISIRDLSNGKSTTIQVPADVPAFGFVGSARFSPDGSRVAYALAKGLPDAEQGWVAVSDGTSGGSKLILTGKTGTYYTVIGWLSDQTLLVETTVFKCGTTCSDELWTVGADGSNPVKVADGSFLAVIDNQ